MNRPQGYYIVIAVLLITDYGQANESTVASQPIVAAASETDPSSEGSSDTSSTGQTSSPKDPTAIQDASAVTEQPTTTTDSEAGSGSEMITDVSSTVTPSSSTVLTTTATPPIKLENLKAVATTKDSITISWTSSASTDVSYTVSFEELSCDSNVITSHATNDKTFTATGLRAGYNYSVTVSTADHQSSMTITAQTNTTAPSGLPSTVSQSHISSKSITFTWEDVACQNRNGKTLSYQLKFINKTHCDNGVHGDVVLNITANESKILTLELAELTPGIVYNFSIRALNSAGASNWYNWTVATTESAPSGLPSAVSERFISSRSINFTWEDVACQDRNGKTLGYQLKFINKTHCDNVVPGDVILNITAKELKTLTLEVTELTPGIVYNFSIRALNSAGASNWRNWTVATNESAPSGLPSAVFERFISSRSINFTWEDVACQDRNGKTLGYQLKFINKTHCENVVPGDVALNITANESKTLTLEVTKLTPGIVYNFSIRALNSAGASNWHTWTVATNESAPSGLPSAVSQSHISPRSITFTWKDVACQDRNGKTLSYEITFNNKTHCDNGVPDKVTRSIKANEFDTSTLELTELTPGIIYDFSIRALNSAGASKRHNWTVETNESAPEAVPEFQYCYFEDWLINLHWNLTDCALSNGQVFYELKWETSGETESETVTTNAQIIGNLSYSQTYNISLRAGTKGGFYHGVSLCRISTPDPPIEAGLIAGATVGAVIAVAAVCAAAAFVFRRRRSTLRTKQTHPIGEVRPIRDISSPEPDIQRNRPIKFDKIEERVNAMHNDSNFAFFTEYKELKELSPKHPTTAARLEANVTKNRFVDILPFDHNRVKLLPSEDEDCSDYINASYLPGNASQRDYIATQGPLPGTIDSFWQMMWEQNVTVVVMLTQLVEKGKRKCEQYWPEALREPQQFGDIQIVKTLEIMRPDYTIRQMEMHLGSQVRHLVQYHYTAWPDHGCPQSTDTILDFVKAVQLRKPKGGQGPTVVHCSAGVGRTGTYVCIERILKMMESGNVDEVDIFAMVLNLREYRARIVQTEDQYVYLHDCIKDAVARRQNSLLNESVEYVNLGGPSSGSPDEW